MPARSWLPALLAAAGLAGCGGDQRLAERVASLERRLDDADAKQQQLLAALRDHGIVVRIGAPRDAAEALAWALDDLDGILARLQSAKDSQDQGKGQDAMTALERCLESLRQHPGVMPALLARAEAAAPLQQPALLECSARVGGTAAAPALLALVRAAERPAALRGSAARALFAVDAGAAIDATKALLQEKAPLPDLYVLVHLLGSTGKPEAMPLLTAALQQNGDRSVRCHAATGLGSFAESAAVDALAQAALGDEYTAVRTNALRALARSSPGERLRDVAGRVAANDADAGVRAVARELTPGR